MSREFKVVLYPLFGASQFFIGFRHAFPVNFLFFMIGAALIGLSILNLKLITRKQETKDPH